MKSQHLSGIVVGLALMALITSPAEAQFGGLKNAIKKKAAEVVTEKVLGKDADSSAKPGSGAPAATVAGPAAPRVRVPTQLEITSDMVTKFTTGLNAEVALRQRIVKRDACTTAFASSQESMTILTQYGPALEKISDSKMSDDQKMAELNRISAEMDAKKVALEVKHCGPVIEVNEDSGMEGVGAAAAGLTQPQYSIMKERIAPFCMALAKGSDQPANSRLILTDAEKTALKPRCSALLVSLKKVL
ncbi:MAG TPA: hypothetical protein VFC35_05630 [Gemmatimonadaceae bacterium]|nr:hypothetical protein [Gemmatimonadaceae bacterium]